MNDVMKIVKKEQVRIIEQHFDNVCSMTVEADADAMPELVGLLKGAGVSFQD